ncbi:MAG: histidine kinase [Dokdonella sp.]|uniref:sensor histidine kinase n=1 Tax=Dokdonella sp. TaxID=2291710 RepID=UPI0025BD4E7A|nr:ATP-binding protein [Dokdonella sp.]MBX3700077.1 histidine kinase [Dokdonella sp.]
MSARPPRWSFETRLLLGTLLVAAPALLVLAALLPGLAASPLVALALWGAMAIITVVLALYLRRRTIYPLYTLTNLLEALREGDYSLRAAHARKGDAVGEVLLEVNSLAQRLREQRLAFEERGALLAKVVATLDLAVVAFDDEARLRLANPAAERLFAAPATQLLGCDAQALGLADCLDSDGGRLLERAFPAGHGRWELRHARFREHGRVHHLVVISDLSRALREEERLAWQRLLRVLGHELNNSLAPIRSMADTLARLAGAATPATDWRDDVRTGLQVIGERAEALAAFMTRYTQLARLPPPTARDCDLATLAQRVAALEQRLPVHAQGPEPAHLHADADQVEQALINLVRNAVDAALDGGGHVTLQWQRAAGTWRIDVVDDGPGLPTSENLFVPFFTTKPGGSGIGLVLARQIIEAHGGSLVLANRDEGRGCVARVSLPAPT